MHPRLVPSPTLAEVFGPGVAYVPRRSPNLVGWSPTGVGQIDFLTGLQVSLAGGMPYVACAATVTAQALELCAEAGLPLDAELHTYRAVGEYLPLLSELMRGGYRLATQRVHPESEVHPESACPHPALLRHLNDKGTMTDLVSGDWLPVRRVLPVAELPEASALLANDRPVVLKASTGSPSGGGNGVWICRTASEVKAARAALSSGERVVIEEHLDIAASICIHGVVYPDGSTALLGAAEEITANGRWLGNWHDAPGDDIPETVVAVVRDIVAEASRRGYRGITGIDVARLTDGTWRVLDLNFRVNGSTAGAWLRDAIERTRGRRVLRGRTWTCAAGFEALIRVARGAVQRGTLIPNGFYDPAACEMGGLARVGGLLIGDSRAEIEEEIRRLQREGLE